MHSGQRFVYFRATYPPRSVNSQLGSAPTYLPGRDISPSGSGATYLPPKLTKPDVSSGPTYLTPSSPNRTLRYTYLFI